MPAFFSSLQLLARPTRTRTQIPRTFRAPSPGRGSKVNRLWGHPPLTTATGPGDDPPGSVVARGWLDRVWSLFGPVGRSNGALMILVGALNSQQRLGSSCVWPTSRLHLPPKDGCGNRGSARGWRSDDDGHVAVLRPRSARWLLPITWATRRGFGCVGLVFFRDRGQKDILYVRRTGWWRKGADFLDVLICCHVASGFLQDRFEWLRFACALLLPCVCEARHLGCRAVLACHGRWPPASSHDGFLGALCSHDAAESYPLV